LFPIRDENVGWLNIAVNNVRGMRSVKRISSLDGQIEEQFHLDRLSTNPLFQRLAFKQLHGDKLPSLVFADVVDGANVWMIQCRCCAGLTQEPFNRCAIAANLISEKFQ